jgi:hypothetical protein
MEIYPKSIKREEKIPVGLVNMYDPTLAWKVDSTDQYLGKFLSDERKSKIAYVAKFQYGNLEYFSGDGFSVKTSELITPTSPREKRRYDDLIPTKDVQPSKQTRQTPSSPVSPAVTQPVPMPVSPAVTQPVSTPMPDSTDASNLRISKLEDELKNAKRTIEILNNMLSKRGIPQANDVTGGKRKSKRKSRRKN